MHMDKCLYVYLIIDLVHLIFMALKRLCEAFIFVGNCIWHNAACNDHNITYTKWDFTRFNWML